MSDIRERILVTGATGFVGGELIPRLLELGHRVRALARQPGQLAARPWARSVEVVAGDLLEPVTLGPALRGVHTAYYLVHSMTSGAGYALRDLAAARHFARAAAEAGVKHIVYLGALADPDERLASHLRSRIDTGAALRSGPVPVTEFRVGVIAGRGSVSFQMIRRVAEVLPVVPGNRWLLHKTQPLAACNAVDYLVAALRAEHARGRVFEIGGPEVTTYADLIMRYARVRGLRRRVVLVPGLPTWLTALGIAVLTPVRWSVARAVVGGLASDSRVVLGDAASTFPGVRLVPFAAAAREASLPARDVPGARRPAFRFGWVRAPGLR